MVMASVRSPANAATIGALSELLTVMHRSRMLHQQGAPAMALVMHVARCGPMRPRDLADAMHLDQSTVSRHLSHLSDLGLVARTPDPADGRAHLVTVTAEGRSELQRVLSMRVHELEQAIDAWTDEDRDDLARLLTKFTDAYTAVIDASQASAEPPSRDTTHEDDR